MKMIFAALGLASFAGANALVIDDFTSGPYSHTSTSVGSLIAQQTGTMLGLQRDLMMTVYSNGFHQSFQQTIGDGMSVTSSGAGLVARLGLDYDGVDVENASGSTFNFGPGTPALDLTTMTALRFNFLANDRTLNVQTNFEGSGLSFSSITIAGNQDSPFVVDVPLSSFVGNVDLNHVDRMTFFFNMQAAGDFALSSIEVVPEPTTIAAIGTALLLLLVRRKR